MHNTLFSLDSGDELVLWLDCCPFDQALEKRLMELISTMPCPPHLYLVREDVVWDREAFRKYSNFRKNSILNIGWSALKFKRCFYHGLFFEQNHFLYLKVGTRLYLSGTELCYKYLFDFAAVLRRDYVVVIFELAREIIYIAETAFGGYHIQSFAGGTQHYGGFGQTEFEQIINRRTASVFMKSLPEIGNRHGAESCHFFQIPLFVEVAFKFAQKFTQAVDVCRLSRCAWPVTMARK